MAGFFLMASCGIHRQPLIEWSVPAEEFSIFISKADPSEDPDERFSIMIVRMPDLVRNCIWYEKV